MYLCQNMKKKFLKLDVTIFCKIKGGDCSKDNQSKEAIKNLNIVLLHLFEVNLLYLKLLISFD